MIPLTDLFAGLELADGALSCAAPDEWRQGRTAFGGLSAALCVEAARRALGALPPLRSAQFAYIGPATGALRAAPVLLRRGRSSAFVAVDLTGEDGLAVRALLCFGAGRASELDYEAIPAPRVKPPEACAGAFASAVRTAGFLQHFDMRVAEPLSGRGAGPGLGAGPGSGADPGAGAAQKMPERLYWVRHVDEDASSLACLIALGDALPPPAMVLLSKPGPISTMVWMTDILTEAPTTEGGWWLTRATAETVRAGYSSQAMTVWSRAGAPVLVGRQNVAVFA